MRDKPPLLHLPKFRELVAELDLHDAKAKEYIEVGWLKYVEWWDTRASHAKQKYHVLHAGFNTSRRLDFNSIAPNDYTN